MKPQLTAHQLANLLLEQEDFPVTLQGCECIRFAAGVERSNDRYGPGIVITNTENTWHKAKPKTKPNIKPNISSRTLQDPKFYYKAKMRGPSYALREKLGWTQARVAKFLGYGVSSVRAWDIGARIIPAEALEKLAEATGNENLDREIDPPRLGLRFESELQPMKQVVIPELNLEQQKFPFAESCLPKTIELARRYRSLILPQLDKLTNKFPYDDRVLIWLASDWLEEISLFHSTDGHGMKEKYDEHKLNRFDDHYFQMLKTRLGNGT